MHRCVCLSPPLRPRCSQAHVSGRVCVTYLHFSGRCMSGDASSLALPWNDRLPESGKRPEYQEGVVACQPQMAHVHYTEAGGQFTQ